MSKGAALGLATMIQRKFDQQFTPLARLVRAITTSF
jgi:hypothetical protein